MANQTENESIDFIITWVDGNDPVWRAEKQKYQLAEIGDSRDSRYREWDILRYWFRSIEKYAPWVNRIFFVTCGHLPHWLNTEHPKLRIVKHSDYIPTEYLPTFSSRTIDMNFHRIPDLSEHFVYFNDDMFLTSPVTPEDFFHKGFPCDSAISDVPSISMTDRDGKTRSGDSIFLADVLGAALMNKYFSKQAVIRKNLGKWYSFKYGKWIFKTLLLSSWTRFSSFRLTHVPYSYLKSTYVELWEKEPELLASACKHRFRCNTDVNHWVFTYWQFAKGHFYPRNTKIARYMYIKNSDNEALFDCIRKQAYKMLCINDEFTSGDFETEKAKLHDAFETVFPEKSGFEI